MMKILRLCLLSLASVFLVACAATGVNEPAPTLEQRLLKSGLEIGDSVATVKGFRLSGWNYLDEHHIQVSTGLRDDYLITFSLPCWGLETANAIAHTSTAGRLSRHDRIVARDVGRMISCPIRDIHVLRHIAKPSTQGVQHE